MAPRHEPAAPLLSRRRRLSGVAALATASLLTTGGVALAGGVSPDRPALASARDDAAHDRSPHGFPGVWGTVTAVGDGTFTVEGRNGETADVVTTGDTTYLDTTKAEVADIEVGAHLVVAGPRIEGSGIDARHLAVKPAPADDAGRGEGKRWMHDVWRSGTVVANDGSTLTVETPDGTITVHTSETTSVTITTEASFDAVEVGDMAKVRGAVGDDGTVNAERVHLGVGGKGHGRTAAATATTEAPTTTVAPTTTAPPAPEPAAAEAPAAETTATLVEGTVTAIDAPAFTVEADDGTVTSVMTTEATAWNARHGRTGDWGSIESLEVGDRVVVKGTVAAGGTLVASVVDIEGDHDRWRDGDHDDWDDDGREHGDWGQDDSDRDDGDQDDDGRRGESWDGRGDGDRGHGERGHEGRRGRGHRGGRH